MKQQLITLLLSLAVASSAMAVPARRGFVKMTGPDGRLIEVQKCGDEFGHHYVDLRGRTLIDAADGRLAIASEAELTAATESRAARFEARNAARSLSPARRVPGKVGTFPGTSFPATGNQKALVVLVEYKDVKFTIGSDAKAKQYFTDMLNKDGFSEYGGTGSVRQYFRENSNGLFDCEFDVYGPVTLANNRRYYGGNDSSGNDKLPEEMVIEACKALDSQINFKDYDRDGDGYVDNVYLIYAGQGEASYGSSETVWPHSWNLSEAGKAFKLDGVTIDLYGCSNEWEEGQPDGMGTFTHEFSHILGLPDLYNTESTVFYTPGEWSVLDYGPYNNDGRTPPAYSSFERNALGWMELTELTADAGQVAIDDLIKTNSALCITNPSNSNEFYLLETRNKSGWDKYLPGAGMLIWHVDYKSSTWSANTVNNTKNHQGVDLIEADGVAVKNGARTTGDCFPGSSKVTSYAPKWWNGKSVGFNISGITRSGTVTTFTVVDPNGGSGVDPNPGPTPGDYLTVAEIIEMDPQKGESTAATLRGYIVGYAKSSFSAKGVHFTATGCDETTNLVLADTPDETDYSFCIPVQLPAGNCRDELNLRDNPANLSRYVELVGKVEAYFGVPGFKSVSAYTFIGQDSIENPEAATESEGNGQWYDLQGRPVANPVRGLYIRNGRKYLLR